MAADRRGRHFDDAGMTLTELLIASTLLVVLLTVVMTTMSVVDSISNSVTAEYQEFDQALPALAPLQALLRAEVEPAPASAATGAPTPAFAAIGNYSLTFYSDVGTAYNNVQTVPGSSPPQVTTAGPAKIVAEELDQSGNPVTSGSSASSCTTTSPCSFQVREYLPITTDGASSCPVTGEPSTNVCQYSTKYTLVTNALDVVNNPDNPNLDPPQSPQPIFTYTVFDPDFGGGTTFSMGYNDVGNQQISGLTAYGYPTDTTQTTNTTPPSFVCSSPDSSYPTIAVSCPTDAIQAVGVDLVISAKGAGTSEVNNQTIVYRYPESAGASAYPYQYSSTVG